MLEVIIISSIKVIVVVIAVLTACAYSTLLERKVLGHMQNRLGPTYAGPYALLQPIADGLKLIFKEDLVLNNIEKTTYTLAPIIAFVPALLSFAVVPFAADFEMFGYPVTGVISDLNIGVLWVFAVTSLGIYGIVLAGWSSSSKYSLFGSLRSAAQMVSYEVAYGLSIIGVILIANTLSMKELVDQQANIWDWYIFKQPFGFLLFITCAVAETNRAPFDLPEAESELAPIRGFCIKVFIFMFCYIWLRATFPRFRYDQLMNFGWKVLFPLALLNTMITAAFVMLKG